MGSKVKNTLKAGLTTLMIPIGKIVLDILLDKLSNEKDIKLSSEKKDRDYYSNRLKEGIARY